MLLIAPREAPDVSRWECSRPVPNPEPLYPTGPTRRLPAAPGGGQPTSRENSVRRRGVRSWRDCSHRLPIESYLGYAV